MEMLNLGVTFTDEDIIVLQTVHKLSLPITSATELLSGDSYPTLSCAVPIICHTEQLIKDVDTSDFPQLLTFKVLFVCLF